MRKPESADMVEGDALEGVPEEECADEQAGDGFEEVAAAGCGHPVTAIGAEVFREVVKERETVKDITAFIVSSLSCRTGARLLAARGV
jgi:hypothetical protein